MRDYLKTLKEQTDQEQDAEPKEKETREITYTRGKPKRRKLPTDLPRETIEYAAV